MEDGRTASQLVREAQRARGQDWPLAASIAAELRERFPDNPIGYEVGAVSSRAMQQLETACALVDEGRSRFPELAWPLAQQGWNFLALDSADAAFAVATALRARFPDEKSGYHLGLVAARTIKKYGDAASIAAQARLKFPTEKWPFVESALNAKEQGNDDQAVSFAAELRDRFPEHPAGYQIGIACLRRLLCIDAAKTLALQGAAKFPSAPWPLAELVATCMASGDLDEAIRWSAELRSRFPDNLNGYRGGAIALRGRNRLDEALQVSREAATRFPSQSWFATEASQLEALKENRNRAERLARALQGQTTDVGASYARAHANEAATSSSQEYASKQYGRAVTRSNLIGQSSKVIVVLGMHRSGTSLCTKIVNALGVGLGAPLLAANFANSDGYYEHMEIVENHNAMLQAAGISWDTIRFAQASNNSFLASTVPITIRVRLKEIVAAQLGANENLWAFKDPRTLRFLPMWKGIFDELNVRPVWILVLREPQAVAASLHSRDRLPIALGELSWVEHNLEALRHLGPQLACVVHYEKWFSSFETQLRSLATAIGSDSTQAIDNVRQTVKTDLRHNLPKTYTTMLDITEEVHSWLISERHDLPDLQIKSQILLNNIESLAAMERDSECS